MTTMKTLATLIVASSALALDVTAHASLTAPHGQSFGVGAANLFDIYENSPVSLELASSINFTQKFEDYAQPSVFIVASAKLDFSWSDYESITIGQRFHLSGSSELNGMNNINHGICVGYKRIINGKTLEINIFDSGTNSGGISITAGKPLEQK